MLKLIEKRPGPTGSSIAVPLPMLWSAALTAGSWRQRKYASFCISSTLGETKSM